MKRIAFILTSLLLIGAAASCEKSGSDKDGKSDGSSREQPFQGRGRSHSRVCRIIPRRNY